jgi:hypothetical protein
MKYLGEKYLKLISLARLEMYKSKGYACLVIWEGEINNNPEDVENKLLKFSLNGKA